MTGAAIRTTALAVSVLGWLANASADPLQTIVPALSAAMTNDEAASRLRELASFIPNLRPEEVPAALQLAIAGHGAGRDDVIKALSGRWVELDAPAAHAFSGKTTDRQARNSLQCAYYEAWIERNGAGALAAVHHGSGEEHATILWLAARKTAIHDPKQAYELIQKVSATNQQDIDYFIFWNWTESNLPQATRTLLDEAKGAGSSYPSQTAVWAITDRLLEDNPQAATKWVMQLPPGKVRDQAFSRILSEWGKVDRGAVLVWLKSLPESDQSRNAILNLSQAPSETVRLRPEPDPAFAGKANELDEILWTSNFWLALKALLSWVDGLAPADFPQALEHLRKAPNSRRNEVIDVLVARWSEIDPEGAIEAIPAAAWIHDSEFSDRFLANVYRAWSKRDPEAAFAAATKGDHRYGNCNVLRVIFTALARQNADDAYAAFRKLNNANSHVLVIPIFAEWAASDLPGATKALFQETHSDGALEGIVIGLMRKSPAAAVTWAESLPDKSLQDRALRTIALRWNGVPAAAAAWLEHLPDFDGKDRAFGDVAVDWAVRDTMGLLRHADTLADGKEKDAMLFWGMAQLTYDDAEAARQFAGQLSGEKNRKRALTTVLNFWSAYHPKAAADFLSSLQKEAAAEDIANVASALSDRDPVSAAHWLETFPDSLDKAPAAGRIAENWYRTDSPAAQAWVGQLPAGSLYDAGARGICAALQGDLSPALKWARSIRDSRIRRDALYQAFEAATCFRVIDLGALDAIRDEIQAVPEFTEADKQTLLSRLPVLSFPQP